MNKFKTWPSIDIIFNIIAYIYLYEVEYKCRIIRFQREHVESDVEQRVSSSGFTRCRF